MKPNIIKVSLNNKFKKFSYPILIGNGLLSNCEEILKKFVLKRKVILIHDNFFSLNNKNNEQFISFVEIIKNLTESVNLIGIPGGEKSKTISKLEYILEESLSNEIDPSTLLLFWEFTLKTLKEINIVANPNLLVEMFLVQLTYLKKKMQHKIISKMN